MHPRLPICPAGSGTVRLSIAIAVSIVLHSVLISALHAPPRVAGPRAAAVLSARLSPMHAAAAAPVPTGSMVQETTEDGYGQPQENPGPAEAGRGLPGLPVPDPRYYLGSELDQRAVPLQAIEPEYPAAAGAREGMLTLRLLIDERGRVDEIAVVRAEPDGVFEPSARSAFAAARFSPGMRGGVPVKSQLLIEVSYRRPAGDPLARSGAAYGD